MKASELETPYLDNAIDGLHHLLIINYTKTSEEKLKEYQQIKAALKRLEELEEERKLAMNVYNENLNKYEAKLNSLKDAARPILAAWEHSDGTERLSELFLNLKNALEQ